MNVLLQTQKIEKSFGTRILFDQASFSINEGEHMGVIGPNGAGKTTLFKVLTGLEELDSGQIIKMKNLNIGYLQQEEDLSKYDSVEGYLTEDLHMPLWQLKKLSLGLGLLEEHFSLSIQQLSGGFRMRAQLLKILAKSPDLLLLDEPTNFLDLESLLVLEQFLLRFPGAFLLISHDREFLNRTTHLVLEIEQGQLTRFNGTIDDYFEQKKILQETLAKQLQSQDAKKKEITAFANRFRAKATKAKQVQSRLKQLEKMTPIETLAIPMKATIKIPPPTKLSQHVLDAQGLTLGYEKKTILSQVQLQLKKGDHVAVVGHNGAGKSTLLKTLSQAIPLLEGELCWGHHVTQAHYFQHITEGLHDNDSILDSFQRDAHLDILPQELKDLAAGLLFREDDMNKKVRVLSGGEKSRVALGKILLKKASLLLLDEPTNHLDFQTVEILTQALSKYPGNLIIVSHDRSFIRRVANKIWEVNHGTLRVYPGTYEEYVWSIEKGAWKEEAEPPPSDSPATPTPLPPPPRSRGKSNRKLAADLRSVEKEISLLEARLKNLTEQIHSPTSKDHKTLSAKMSDTQSKIEILEIRWYEISEELSAL